MIEFIDRGIAPYRTIWDEQQKLFNLLISKKREGLPIENEYIIFVEHHPVYTMGRHANESNMLMTKQWLESNNVECIPIERGGDITFHGPGQLVVYPIVDLQYHKLGVKKYVTLLEEAVISVIGRYGIKGERIEGATGVWINAGEPTERKVCAIGIRCSRSITMHGLALNVSTDISYFSRINPCGFVDKGVTSMSLELNRHINMTEIKAAMKEELSRLLK